MREVTVIKQNIHGQETWRYPAQVIRDLPGAVLLEAYFNIEHADVGGLVMNRGDRFVEAYYTGRWYNIFEVYDREDTLLKGWYCNISFPAVITPDTVSWADLALDLLVFPDGRQQVMDEDEFAALPLTPEVRAQAQTALQDLQALFRSQPGFRLAA